MTDHARDLRLDDPEADQLMVETPELWRYLPQLLAYPVRGYGLMVTLCFGGALWVIGYAGVWGIPAAGIIFGWMSYYFMDVVQRSATGHAIPPPMGSEVMFQGDKLRLAMLVGYLGAFTLLVLSANHSDQNGLGVFLFALGVYCLPAFLASLALQPDLISVLNPWLMLKFMWHTGIAYIFSALVLAVVGFLGIALAGRVSAISSDVLLVYGVIFVCHMVGYVAYHHAEELDIAVQVEKPTDITRAEAAQAIRVAEVMAQIDRHLQAHETKTARDALLSDDGSEQANPRAFHEELFEALRLRHEDALSLAQAQRLIRLLLQQKRLPRALDICEQCLDLDKGFLPEPGTMVAVLADQALKDKRLKLFAALDAAVQARAPQGDEAVSMQFLKAQALVDQKQDGAALVLLTPLQSRSTHPWAPRIQALYKALQGTQKKT
jgi:hypothetical protein